MADEPTTDEIVKALLVLGVQGPAVAADVLAAAGLALPTAQLPAVLNGVVLARERERQNTQARS